MKQVFGMKCGGDLLAPCSILRAPAFQPAPQQSTARYQPHERRSRRALRCQASSANGAGPLPTAVAAPAADAQEQPGLILPRGVPGAWDEAGLGHPIVRYYLGDNEQRWFMWYSGRSEGCHNLDAVFPSSGSVGVAVSEDGITWQRGSGPVTGDRGEGRALDVGRCLAPNEDWWWHDTCHMHAGDVQILSNDSVSGGTGVYWMFYSGGSFEQVELPAGLRIGGSSGAEASQQGGAAAALGSMEGLRLRPGLAMSPDGRNWARIEAEHHSGALFDVGAEGEWDELFIGAPQVVAAGPRDMRMYYHSYDRQGRHVVGAATSPDGFKWTKVGPIFDGGSSPDDFDAGGAAARCVVRDIDSRLFFMFYEAVAADGARTIGLAVSKDGLKGWQRCPEPVLRPSGEPGAWDGGSVGTPWAVSMAGGRWRLYYSGRREAAGGWEGLGLALSQEGQQFKQAPSAFQRRRSKGSG